MKISVMETGATGNGIAKDTMAVRKAITMCTENGGGEVTFPAGKYLLGKVELASYITIILENGCEIIASSDAEDYPASKGSPDCSDIEGEDGCRKRLAVFYGCGLESVAIKGEGAINGNYKNILTPASNKLNHKWIDHGKDYDIYAMNGFRCMLVYFEACRNVCVENIRLFDASCYTIFLRSCNFVKISGIRIDNYLGANNSDGLHLCSCSDVRISDCDLTCGDDAIAIDSNDGKPAERFVISNCVITSRNNCLRLYTGLLTAGPSDHPYGLVRDVTMIGCMARRADSYVSINADRGEISNIQIIGASGTVLGAGTAFLLSSHNKGYLHRVKFLQWNITAHGAGYFYADKETGGRIDDIVLSDVDILVKPIAKMYGCGMTNIPRLPDDVLPGIPMYWLYHVMPWFMQIINAETVLLEKVKIVWGDEELEGMETMETEDGTTLIKTITEQWKWPMPKAFTNDWPAVWATGVKKLKLNDVDAKPHGNFADWIYTE